MKPQPIWRELVGHGACNTYIARFELQYANMTWVWAGVLHHRSGTWNEWPKINIIRIVTRMMDFLESIQRRHAKLGSHVTTMNALNCYSAMLNITIFYLPLCDEECTDVAAFDECMTLKRCSHADTNNGGEKMLEKHAQFIYSFNWLGLSILTRLDVTWQSTWNEVLE